MDPLSDFLRVVRLDGAFFYAVEAAEPWSVESAAARELQQVTEESQLGRPGADSVLTGLADLMFIELLRRYLEELPPGQTGWLAGLRDEVVGRVLEMLHTRPGHPWTLDELAREAASSRSSLAKRFAELVGQPPMAVPRPMADAGRGQPPGPEWRQDRDDWQGSRVRFRGCVQPGVQKGGRACPRSLARGPPHWPIVGLSGPAIPSANLDHCLFSTKTRRTRRSRRIP
jgi:AraC-like DNA-binding protein